MRLNPARTFVLASVVAGALFCQAQMTYKYVTFSYPGAVSTTATGINNNNVIVGSWLDGKNVSHGYRYQNSNFTNINYPGAQQTYANGLNDAGDIVGTYIVNNVAHGFLLHNGAFHKIDFPGAQSTAPAAINKYGVIVGAIYINGLRGFILSGGHYTLYDAPSNSGFDSELNGISSYGAMVGQVFSFDNWRAFLRNGNDVDFLSAVATLDNEAYGINGRGDVVGCHDGGNGFLALNPEASDLSEGSEKPGWKTQPILVAPNTGTCPMSINYVRVIVGNVGSGPSTTRGFLAVPH